MADDIDRLLRIGNAGQLDDDLIAAAGLDDWLAYAQATDAALDRVTSPLKRVFIDGGPGWRIGLQEHLDAALQIEPFLNRVIGFEGASIERIAGKRNPTRE